MARERYNKHSFVKAAARKALLVFPLLFLLELVFGESGDWLVVGSTSIRKILFILALLSLYSYAALFWRHLKFSKVDAAVLFFIVVNTLWGSLVPALYDRSLGLTFADFGAVYVLLLYFPLARLLRADVLSWRQVKTIFLGAVSLFALCHIVIWIIVAYEPDLRREVRKGFFELFEPPAIFVGPMPDGFFRVMLVTSIFVLPAFFALSYALVEGKRRMLTVSLLFVASSALIVMYSRTFWIAIVFGLILAGAGVLLERRAAREPLRFSRLGRELLPILVFAAAFVFVSAVNAGAQSTSGTQQPTSGAQQPAVPSATDRITSTVDTEDESVATKLKQVPYLVNEWKSAPLFGKGFGAHAEEYSRGRALYSYELLAPTLLMKLGIIGSVLWISPLLYIVVDALRTARATENLSHARYTVAGFLSFALAVQGNPWLLNFVGMSILLLYLLEFAVVKNGRPYLKVLLLDGGLDGKRPETAHPLKDGR